MTARRARPAQPEILAVQIMVAVPSPAVARRLSAALLDAGLCACAQTVGPIVSRYIWQGRRESAREWLLVVKTRQSLFAAVESAVRALHPYTVPEIAATPLTAVHAPYLAWLIAATTAPTRSAPRRAPASKRAKPGGHRFRAG